MLSGILEEPFSITTSTWRRRKRKLFWQRGRRRRWEGRSERSERNLPEASCRCRESAPATDQGFGSAKDHFCSRRQCFSVLRERCGPSPLPVRTAAGLAGGLICAPGRRKFTSRAQIHPILCPAECDSEAGGRRRGARGGSSPRSSSGAESPGRKKPPDCPVAFGVWVTRLERATSWSLTRCATNCATPRCPRKGLQR